MPACLPVIWCRVRTDAELADLNEHTIPRLDHFLFDWQTKGRSTDWQLRKQLKAALPEWLTGAVDAFFGIVFDGKAVLKLDTDRLVEVMTQITFQSRSEQSPGAAYFCR
jgi:hypothetical protein